MGLRIPVAEAEPDAAVCRLSDIGQRSMTLAERGWRICPRDSRKLALDYNVEAFCGIHEFNFACNRCVITGEIVEPMMMSVRV